MGSRCRDNSTTDQRRPILGSVFQPHLTQRGSSSSEIATAVPNGEETLADESGTRPCCCVVQPTVAVGRFRRWLRHTPRWLLCMWLSMLLFLLSAVVIVGTAHTT